MGQTKNKNNDEEGKGRVEGMEGAASAALLVAEEPQARDDKEADRQTDRDREDRSSKGKR